MGIYETKFVLHVKLFEAFSTPESGADSAAPSVADVAADPLTAASYLEVRIYAPQVI